MQPGLIVLILSLLLGLQPITTDLYLPALPALTAGFGASHAGVLHQGHTACRMRVGDRQPQGISCIRSWQTRQIQQTFDHFLHLRFACFAVTCNGFFHL